MEGVYFETADAEAPVRIARGDEDVARRAPRQKLAQFFGPFGVVEHQQPARVGVQPAAHGGHDDGLFARFSFGQAEILRQRGVIGGERDVVFGANPPDCVVFGGVAISVFDRRLRLAHAAVRWRSNISTLGSPR